MDRISALDSETSCILDGETEGSLQGTRRHAELGSAWRKYVRVARHSASMEGRPKAGPQT